jgi:hypothetical protein
MKKTVIFFVIAAVLVVGFGMSRNINPQPADVSRSVPISGSQKLGPAVDNSNLKKTPIVTNSASNEILVRPSTTTKPSTSTPKTSEIKPQIVPIKEISSTVSSATETLEQQHSTPQSSMIATLFGRRRERYWCQDNGDGTVTYGTANWVCDKRPLNLICLGGHWDYGIGLTMPGGASTCAGYLQGVPSISLP